MIKLQPSFLSYLETSREYCHATRVDNPPSQNDSFFA